MGEIDKTRGRRRIKKTRERVNKRLTGQKENKVQEKKLSNLQRQRRNENAIGEQRGFFTPASGTVFRCIDLVKKVGRTCSGLP